MDSVAFFTSLFKGMEKSDVIEVRLLKPTSGKKKSPESIHFYTLSQLVKELPTLQKYAGHAFFGVNPRKTKKSTKEAVARVRVVWADFDSDILPPYPLPPTWTVRTGRGRHLYWVLNEPALDHSAAEDMVKQWLTRLGEKDASTRDVTRMMRIPGSTNPKTKPPTLVTIESHHNMIYKWDEMVNALSVPKDVVEMMFHADSAGKHSRSERDWTILRAYLSEGFTAERVKEIMLCYPCGNKIQEDAPNYWTRTVKAATRSVEKSKEKSEVQEEFLEEGDAYLIQHGKTRIPVSTFVFQPTSLLENTAPDTQDALQGTLRIAGYSWERVVLPKKAFSSVQAMSMALPQAAAVWLGNDKQLRQLLAYLMEKLRTQGLPRITATSVQGRHGNVWVGENEVVTSESVLEKDSRPVVYLATGRESLKTSYAMLPKGKTQELVRKVWKHIPNVNRPEVIFPLLGWLYATPYKSLLWERGIRFPHLNIFGTRGSGKTMTISRILLPLMGIVDRRSYDAGTTNFVLMALLGSTNSLPVSLSEFRASSVQRLIRYLLLAYDSGRDVRGKSDQTTAEYPLLAPIILDGEDAVSDAATKERTLVVRMSPETIAYKNLHERAFQAVVGFPLHQLATPYLQYTLTHPPQWEESHELVDSAFEGVTMPDRVRNNLSVVVMGWMHLLEWLNQYGLKPFVLTPEWVKNTLLETLRNVVAESGRTFILADEFVEAVLNQVSSGGADNKFFYVINKKDGTVSFHLNTAFAWWRRERSAQRLPVLESAAIKAQLKEREIRTKEFSPGQYIRAIGAVSHKGKTLWMYTVGLSEASRSELDIAVPVNSPSGENNNANNLKKEQSGGSHPVRGSGQHRSPRNGSRSGAKRNANRNVRLRSKALSGDSVGEGSVEPLRDSQSNSENRVNGSKRINFRSNRYSAEPQLGQSGSEE